MLPEYYTHKLQQYKSLNQQLCRCYLLLVHMVRMHKVQEMLYHQRDQQVQAREKYCYQRSYNQLSPKTQQYTYKQGEGQYPFLLLLILLTLGLQLDSLEQLEAWICELRLCFYLKMYLATWWSVFCRYA